jgi:NAD(P)H dehydrogenase (quinone)
MKKIAIVYHSGFGHTALFANEIKKGVEAVSGIECDLIHTDDATKKIDDLAKYDGLLFGTPTYMGNVSGPFKTFMDATAGVWMKAGWKDKLAGGFTVSGSPSGDKLNTLQSLAVFAAQHGMIWIGSHQMPEIYQGVAPEQAANRLGSYLGAMAQAANDAPEKSFVPGDLKTARIYGERFATIVKKL